MFVFGSLHEHARQHTNYIKPSLFFLPRAQDLVGITELVAIIGAIVGGWTARKRQEEVRRARGAQPETRGIWRLCSLFHPTRLFFSLPGLLNPPPTHTHTCEGDAAERAAAGNQPAVQAAAVRAHQGRQGEAGRGFVALFNMTRQVCILCGF